MPPPVPRRRRTHRLFIFGCAAGCLGLVLAFILGLTLMVLAALDLHPFEPKPPPGVAPVPREFVGIWQAADDPRSTITIRPDGKGDCDIYHGSGDYQLTGARVRYDDVHRSLSLKYSILGPSWHVDEPPHLAGAWTEMRLNGRVYRKVGPATQPLPGKTWIIHRRPDGLLRLRLPLRLRLRLLLN